MRSLYKLETKSHKKIKLHCGDCLKVLPTLEAGSVDAIVTDAPYGLEFMGKEWDKLGKPDPGNLGGFANGHKPSFARVNRHLAGMQEWHYQWAVEGLRVLKPGGYMLAFGGTRTYHRLACAIEDAGFEIRDCVMWLYGQGFPKSKGCLKPAWEPILLARKAGAKVRALGIDSCRVLAKGGSPAVARRESANRPGASVAFLQAGCGAEERKRIEASGRFCRENTLVSYTARRPGEHIGRWPANVALDEEAARILDESVGELGQSSNHGGIITSQPGFGGGWGTRKQFGYGDTGGASRFFYCAKASRRERNAGLNGFDKRMLRWSSGDQSPGTFQSNGTDKYAQNFHPTVKPLALMRWLCRLVCPPEGLILDPFLGSGTTGCACVKEGFRFIGIEREADYMKIARARIAAARKSARTKVAA